MVIGSRTRGGSDELHGTAEQLLRYVGSQLIMLAINYRFGVRLTDSQNGFRAIRKDVAAALGAKANLTTIEQEMLMRALKRGCRVVEVPTHEFERKSGVSKVSVWRLWLAYLWSLIRNIV
jgi:dolichol-phosphate mannosyltransferase